MQYYEKRPTVRPCGRLFFVKRGGAGLSPCTPSPEGRGIGLSLPLPGLSLPLPQGEGTQLARACHVERSETSPGGHDKEKGLPQEHVLRETLHFIQGDKAFGLPIPSLRAPSLRGRGPSACEHVMLSAAKHLPQDTIKRRASRRNMSFGRPFISFRVTRHSGCQSRRYARPLPMGEGWGGAAWGSL